MQHPIPQPTKGNWLSPTLIVFLENGGQISGIDLPPWVGRVIDRAADAYGQLAVWLQAHRHYSRIVFLADRQATAANLWQALLDAGDATVDLLLLVHGQEGYACGYGRGPVGADFFHGLRQLRAAGLAPFRLRAVYQMNCYGYSLAPEWLSLGAQAVNGSVGVNWLPEPSLSVFLHGWLGGSTFARAVERSNRAASNLLGTVWRPQVLRDGSRLPNPKIDSSRMLVFGDAGLRRDRRR